MRVVWSRNTYKGEVLKKTTKQDITKFVSKLTWSGASTQASRQVLISLANPVYDKNINVPKVAPGDIIKVYAGKEKKPRFVGRVSNRQLTSEVGTIEIVAYDYMHNLLGSTMTKKFKNKTPEYITKAVLKDLGISAGKIKATKKKIKRYFPDQMSPYDVIVGAYGKASKKTGKKYFFRMNGTKFEVIEKGEYVATYLEEKVNLTKSDYESDSESVVNKVNVYKKNKKVNTVKNAASMKKYGTVQQAITVEKGKGKKEAKNTLKGLDRNASISATGIWSCTAGKAVYVKDKISGLSGKYWIVNDTHTFENGIHTMELDLEFKEVMEKADVKEVEKAKKKSSSSGGDTSDGTNNDAATGGVKARRQSSTEKYIYKTTKKNATFTAYYPGEGGCWVDSHDRKLVAAKMTCAAARSLSFNTKITVKGTGTKYDGKTFKVTDRPARDLLRGKLHIDLLLPDAAACNAFGVREGKIVIKKKVKNKNYKSNTKAAKVVEIARSYIGKVSYRMGARNVPGGVSDCSGFTKYCFSRIGVSIGEDTREQSRAGKYIQKGKQKKGDLVIFQGTYRPGPSHVGIMVDKKNFIHCSSSGGVKITPLSNSYHVQHFHSIRRVV